jgi:hypothetical protein
MKKLYYILILPMLMGAMACMHLTSSTSRQPTVLDLLKSGDDVNLKNKTISETLDLNQVWKVDQRSIRMGSALFFQGCTFQSDIIAENRTGGRWVWEGDVIFENCHFEGDFRMTDAVFDGRVRIINCTFSKGLDLQRGTFRNAVRISGNQAGNDILLQYSRFYHDLQAMDNQPGRFILAQGISVQGQTQISGTKAQGIDLGQSHFHEDVSANYLEVSEKINLSGSLCLGDFSIQDTKNESNVTSKGFEVRGQLDMDPSFKKK